MDLVEESTATDVDLLELQVWNQYWIEIERRIGSVFARSDVRTRAITYLGGLLSTVERKNSWQLAESSGDATPYGLQHLLGRADWNADALRDRLRTYVTDYLATPDAVGVVDETGFLKKGVHSAGVARQYSGTAGRIENAQIGVFLTYASTKGHTLLDRELYLPAVWTEDRGRCQRAGIPADRRFATKPELAVQMLERTRAAGVALAWVTGDCIYGDSRLLRSWLEDHRQAYVLAVSGKDVVWHEQRQRSVKTILAGVPSEGWTHYSAGAGSKGPRWYDWLRLDLRDPVQDGWKRWLVIRRSKSDLTGVTAYVVYAPAASTLAEQVRVAGMRWTIEESIQIAKGEVGLDHYEVRSWTGWYRHITLAMWAQAFLTVIRAETGAAAVPKKRGQATMTRSLTHFKAHRGLRSA
ncbi:MAG: IS701 family transposase [Herpetosiphon sp.]